MDKLAPDAAIARRTRMPVWRVALNWVGGFVIGFIALVIIVVGSWRVFAMPTYHTLPNVAHAGGGIGDETYINGISAFNQAYANGFRQFEVDFERTTEGDIVCGHDWHGFKDIIPDMQTFLMHRAKMKYPMCTLNELLDWFHQHPDAQLVSDAKADVLTINKSLRLGLGAQLIAEGYTPQNIVDMSLVNRNPAIFALYKLDGIPTKFEAIGALGTKPLKLTAVAMSTADVAYGLALWSKWVLHVPVYVYTVNSCSQAPMLRLLGADSLYTDTLGAEPCS